MEEDEKTKEISLALFRGLLKCLDNIVREKPYVTEKHIIAAVGSVFTTLLTKTCLGSPHEERREKLQELFSNLGDHILSGARDLEEMGILGSDEHV
jgi:hypothetical protein